MPKFCVTVLEQHTYSINVEAVNKEDAREAAILMVEGDTPPEPDHVEIDAEDCEVDLIEIADAA
jgi:methenyltetrahydromethanopterin cyclohydrolase